MCYFWTLTGFETSSSTLSFCLYELAKNRNIQQRVHDEIDRVLAQHNGQITYESISEMKFLDQCIDGLVFDHLLSFTRLKKLQSLLIVFHLTFVFRDSSIVSNSTGFISSMCAKLQHTGDR